MYRTVYCVWLEVPDLGNNPATNNVVPLLPPLLSLSLPLPLSLTYSISFFSCSPSSSPCLTLHSAYSSSYTSLRPPLLSIRLCLSPSDRSVLHLRFPPPVHVPPHSWFTHPHLPPSSPFSNARRIRGFRKPYAEHLDSLLLILCRCHSVVSKTPSYRRPLLSQTLLSLLDFAYWFLPSHTGWLACAPI